MKRIVLLILGVFIFSITPFAQEKVEGTEVKKEENKKLEIKPYGFIKGDMIYTTKGVNSFGADNLSAPQVANGIDRATTGLTAQHTRLGVKSTVGDKIKVGGLVEIDFYGGAFDANIKPRLRLAYASIATGGFEAKMGQQWDLFSPNNANTNNTNGNLWYAGNRGFRRSQLQLSYTIANDKFSPMVQFSVGETSKEDAGLGKDNLSGMPMIQGRISGKIMKKYVIGISFVSGKYLEKKGTIIALDTLKKDFKFSTTGIGVDFNLPFHKYFSLLGEFNTGTNLNNANLFSVAGNHSWGFSGGNVVQNDKKSMGYWLNATSNITDWFGVVVGYGLDKNTSSKYVTNNIEKNSVLYLDFVFPIKHGFSVALEVQNIKTTVVNTTDANGKILTTKDLDANVINLSAKVTF